jgi:hypothetical protein
MHYFIPSNLLGYYTLSKKRVTIYYTTGTLNFTTSPAKDNLSTLFVRN